MNIFRVFYKLPKENQIKSCFFSIFSASALGSIVDEPPVKTHDYKNVQEVDSEIHMKPDPPYSEPEADRTAFQPAPVSLDSAWKRRSSEDSHTDKVRAKFKCTLKHQLMTTST